MSFKKEMKIRKFIIAILLILNCLITNAGPLSKTCHILSTDISLDIYTRADMFTDSVWYYTIMPAYNINYRLNLNTSKKKLHIFSFNLRYFMGNRFSLNSVKLDKDALKIFLFDFEFEYIRYLPINHFISFMIGGQLAPRYDSFEQKVSNTTSNTISEIIIGIGPVFGFSFYKTDFFEFSSKMSIKFGFPVYGKLIYPDNSHDKLKRFSVEGKVSSIINFYLNKFTIGISYDYSLCGSLSFIKENGPTTPVDTIMTGTHSISIILGVIL